MAKRRSRAHLKVQKQVKILDSYQCCACGSQNKPEGHHLIPYSEGGEAHINNMLTLCQSCHRKYHSGTLKIDIIRF
ncbi:MAG: HNH endonuclease [Cyanobacteria bacterium J06639_18]